MGIKRKELDKIYHDVKKLYRRKWRDRHTQFGIDVMYEAIMDYMDGKPIERKEY